MPPNLPSPFPMSPSAKNPRSLPVPQFPIQPPSPMSDASSTPTISMKNSRQQSAIGSPHQISPKLPSATISLSQIPASLSFSPLTIFFTPPIMPPNPTASSPAATTPRTIGRSIAPPI